MSIDGESDRLSVILSDEIKTRSIETILLPLFNQVTTLINAKERAFKSEKTQAALKRVSQAVSQAIGRFALIGNNIANDNPDIELEMREACTDVESAGLEIQQLTEHSSGEQSPTEKINVIESARQLLTSITRVLLIADKVAIKQLLQSKEHVASCLTPLEHCKTLQEFVTCFKHFGDAMVEFARVSGERQKDLKSPKGRSIMAANRSILERTIQMLLHSCKNCLRHPNTVEAYKTRDGILQLMHSSLKNIELLVSYGLPVSKSNHSGDSGIDMPSKPGSETETFIRPNRTHRLCRILSDLIEVTTMAHCLSSNAELLMSCMNNFSDVCLEFTDCAFTSQQHRERILSQLERLQDAIHELIDTTSSSNGDNGSDVIGGSEMSGISATKAKETLTFLRKEIEQTAIDQCSELLSSHIEPITTLEKLQAASMANDTHVMNQTTVSFYHHAEHFQEAAKFLHHIAPEGELEVETNSLVTWMRAITPIMMAALKVLQLQPQSKTALDTVKQFTEAWSWSIGEITRLLQSVSAAVHLKLEKQIYSSLPRPGKHGITVRRVQQCQKLEPKDFEKMSRNGLEVRMLSSEMEARQPRSIGACAADPLMRHTRVLSTLAMQSYRFTRGEGSLKTTQDLFNNSDYIVQEGLVLYGVIKNGVIKQLPMSTAKGDLQSLNNRLPGLCHKLHFILKSATIGKAATFAKVDNVIRETKNLMIVVNQIITMTTGASILMPSTRRLQQQVPKPNAEATGGIAKERFATTTKNFGSSLSTGSHSLDFKALIDPF